MSWRKLSTQSFMTGCSTFLGGATKSLLPFRWRAGVDISEENVILSSYRSLLSFMNCGCSFLIRPRMLTSLASELRNSLFYSLSSTALRARGLSSNCLRKLPEKAGYPASSCGPISAWEFLRSSEIKCRSLSKWIRFARGVSLTLSLRS